MTKENECPDAVLSCIEGNIKKQKPFYHTTIKSELESQLNDDSKSHKDGALEILITDKAKSQKASVKALLQEIELRENLNLHLLNKINNEICRQNTQLIQKKKIRAHYSFELYKEINSLKAKLEDNVLELKKEKRKEYLECWRDLMFLKRYLMVALKEYWDLVKRREVLGVSNIM